MPYPKQPDICPGWCGKPSLRRENGKRRWCPDCSRQKRLLHKYGITHEDYMVMWNEQEGLCKICKQPETEPRADGTIRWLSIDHDHGTLELRGLLCYHCNQGLGHFRDNPGYMIAAAQYIKAKTPEKLRVRRP